MRAGKARSICPALLAAVLLAAIPAFAGQSGHLVGTVTDEEGRAISGARVTLVRSGAASPRTVVTDPRGEYRMFVMDAVRPVNVLAEAGGKIAVEYKGVRVIPDRVTRFDLRLRGHGAHDILVLVDARVPYHNLALEGARSTLPGRLQVIRFVEVTPSLHRSVLRKLENRPSAVLAIGEEAARLARSLAREVPVVHSMVPDPHPDVFATENVCGLSMTGGFDRQVERLVSLEPDLRRIGILFDPSTLAHAATELRIAVEAAGMELVAGRVHDPYDLPRALDDLGREDLDAFVVLMDPEIYTTRNFDLVRHFAEERELILVVPDPSMAGATKSFSFEPGFWKSGAVAGRLVEQIVEGTLRPDAVGVRPPTEGEVAAIVASVEPGAVWTPDPGAKPPLVGSRPAADDMGESSSGGSR